MRAEENLGGKGVGGLLPWRDRFYTDAKTIAACSAMLAAVLPVIGKAAVRAAN